MVGFSLLIIGISGYHFKIALVFGLIAHIDRVLIYILLRQWDHDIPSSYHAYMLRQGKQILRNKLTLPNSKQTSSWGEVSCELKNGSLTIFVVQPISQILSN